VIEKMFIPMRHFLTSVWGERTITQWVANVLLFVHSGLGIAIMVGGIARLTPPSYDPLIYLVHGQVWILGVWSLVVACLLVVPLRWPNIIGLFLGMVWMWLWTGMFTVAVTQFPTASATAIIAYAGFGLLDLGLLAVRVIDRDKG
jgi:hypothetical protein